MAIGLTIGLSTVHNSFPQYHIGAPSAHHSNIAPADCVAVILQINNPYFPQVPNFLNSKYENFKLSDSCR